MTEYTVEDIRNHRTMTHCCWCSGPLSIEWTDESLAGIVEIINRGVVDWNEFQMICDDCGVGLRGGEDHLLN